ncbi:MAG TPA: hypothetical protein VN673_11320, partial [Clostridia bacterium]|nr:hypothetical protein [Clostridia bacterium]
MLNLFSKTVLATLIPLLLVSAPITALAQARTSPKKSTPAQADPETPASARKKQAAGPFHGKLKAIDRAKGTLVMGTRTFQVTAQTKITKHGKSATLADGVIGESVSGYFKTSEDGKLALSSLRFGPKPDAGEGKGTPEKPGRL